MRYLPLCALLGACSTAPGPVVPTSDVERKMIGLLEKFDRWDDDGNGELDRHELAVGLKGHDHSPEEVIAFYDTNSSGTISLKEAQAGYKRASEAEEIVKKRSAE